MLDKMCAGPVYGSPPIKEAVCVSTRKVYDSCRHKDCQRDVRIYPTRGGQDIIDRAAGVKPRSAELLWIYVDVEPVPFDKGFYTVDARYYYKVKLDAFFGAGRPCEVTGLGSFSKRTVMFGSEGAVRIFSSKYVPGEFDRQTCEKTNLPTAVVEVVDPILLDVRLEARECDCCCGLSEVPESICGCFDDELVLSEQGKRIFATIGQFAIMSLERDIRLLMPSYDVCMPAKECCSAECQDPCTLFERFKFPVDEFFPPEFRESADKPMVRETCQSGQKK